MRLQAQLMSPAKIFVAVKPEPLPVVKEALLDYEICVAHKFEDAAALLASEQKIDLFLVGILWDESKAMDLIKQINSRKQPKVPIVVVRLMQSQHEEMLKSTMETMIEVKLVTEYLEVPYNHPGAKRIIRNAVEKYLQTELLSH